jgi:hypothetical protein
MEIITIKVQTQAQVEIILAKIKEVGNEEMTITTKHSAKKRAITKVAKEKSKGKIIRKKKPAETGSIQGLKELKLILEGTIDYKRDVEGLDKL